MSLRQAGRSIIRLGTLLVLVNITAFFLVAVSPLGPLKTNAGQAALGSMSQEQIVQFEEYWGVNTLPVKRYVSWAGDLLQGDMGMSLLYRRPVSKVIEEKLVNSLWLMASAWVISGVVGFVLGVAVGARKGRLTDKLISGHALITASTPAFWLVSVLLMVSAVWLRILPIGLSVPIGMGVFAVTLGDRLVHGILLVAAFPTTGIFNTVLHTREKMAEAMESDYALFVRVRGESEWEIVKRHGIRNVLLPAMTLQFALISETFGGSVLVEQVFSYLGLGRAAVMAGLGGDMPLLLGITMISAAIAFGGNLTVNMPYQVVDPRIGKRRAG